MGTAAKPPAGDGDDGDGGWKPRPGGRAVPAILLAVFTAGPGCAGRDRPAQEPARQLCSIDTTVGVEKAPRDRAFPPAYWFVLLLEGYQSSGGVARPAKDCRGWPIKLAPEGCGGDDSVPPMTATALGTRDLVVSSLGDARRLVWAMTDRLEDGQAQGPVAIAEINQRGVVVRTLGILRAYPHNVSLRLERVGIGTVLVAEGESCVDPDQPTASERCERAIRVVPLLGDRFVPKPIVDDKGVCVGSALFPIRAAGDAGKGRAARYKLEASVTVGPDNIGIREQLVLTRAQAATDVAGGSFVTRVSAERQITWRGGSLVATGPSLLTRWLAEQAGAPGTSPR